MFQIQVKKKPDKLIKQLTKLSRGDFKVFLKPAGGSIRDNIISNILHQITPEGGTLKKNADSTLEFKRKRGFGQLSLIAQFRLLVSKSTYVIKVQKAKVLVTLKKVRLNVGKALEKKKYRFFGISVVIRTKIFQDWRKFIKRGFR